RGVAFRNPLLRLTNFRERGRAGVVLLTLRTLLGRTCSCWERWASGRGESPRAAFSFLARADRNTRAGQAQMTMHFDPPPDAAEGLPVTGRDGPGRGRGGLDPQGAAILDAFDIADGLFREAAEDFARLRRQLREGGGEGGGRGRAARRPDPAVMGDGLKEAVRLARELRTATQLMLEERNRVDK